MSLLCAAGHMESSLYVWRRCCDADGDGDSNWARAAVFEFLLSLKHTHSRNSFVQFLFDFFLFLLFFWALCTPSRLSYCPTHHTHRCWPSATLAVCFFFFFFCFFFIILSPLCSLHSPLSAVLCTLSSWRSFIHASFSSYLCHSYSHCSVTVCVCMCVCVLYSIRVLVRAALVFVLSPRFVVVAVVARD